MEQRPTRDGFLALLGEPPAERPPIDIEVPPDEAPVGPSAGCLSSWSFH